MRWRAVGYDRAALGDPVVAAINRGAVEQAPVLPWRMHSTDHLAVWSHYFRFVLQLVEPGTMGRQAQALDN